MAANKVVKLVTERAENAPPQPLPPVLEALRVQASEVLGHRLVAMLDHADDRLFELSESGPDSERRGFFDNMRALRLARAGVERRFRQELEHAFAQLGTPIASAPAPLDLDTLSLVEDDELERNVAMDTMARRLRGQAEADLAALSQRIGSLLPAKTAVPLQRLPLDPRQVVAAFAAALTELALDLPSALRLLKLFELQVLARLPELLAAANKALADAGVMPGLTPVPAAGRAEAPSRHADVPPRHAAGGAEPAGSESLHELLQELVSSLRERPLHGSADAAALPQREVSSGELMDWLDRLPAVAPGERVDLRGQLSQLMTEPGAAEQPALQQADEAVLNLVAMLFDFILEDVALAADIKALLGRLQIPLLKVALADAELLSDDDHDARQLLNLLARAGGEWTPGQGQQDPFFQLVESTVQQLLDAPVIDRPLLAQLRAQVAATLETLLARNARLEARLRELEEGRARAEAAQQAAEAALAARLSGRPLPEGVAAWISSLASAMLPWTWLREGEDSPRWRQQLKLLDALVWSLTPMTDPTARTRLQGLSPAILRGMADGLAEQGHDPVAARAHLTRLQALHGAQLRGELRAGRVPEALADSEWVRPQPPLLTEALPAAPAAAVPPAPLPEPASLPDAELRQARQLKPGRWLHFAAEAGGEPQRCKVVANLRGGDKIVLVNGRGIKVREESAASLAVALANGTVTLVDDQGLFDRALEAVIGDLRRKQRPQR
ncbi:DUF1631 family protein [Isoalcanivorax beigongshangi]|uniref:DUF1631 family protein n=1 Tax=Isoalcanivorax beigongshangi TaxID=3238810 RepID=A0ABV4ALL8_9GAMM